MHGYLSALVKREMVKWFTCWGEGVKRGVLVGFLLLGLYTEGLLCCAVCGRDNVGCGKKSVEVFWESVVLAGVLRIGW